MKYLKADRSINGHDWEITTSKRRNQIATIAQRGKKSESGLCFSFSMFKDPSVTLHVSEATRATEKALKECHQIGLANFETNEEIQAKSEKKETIEIGQIIFTEGYENENRRVIYEIENGRYGVSYRTINLETLEISFSDRISPYSEKFGIGVYYHEGDTYQGDLEELRIKAVALAEEKAEAERIAKEKAAEEKARKIEEGKKLLSLPGWAKGVIVCHFKQNESDPYTDYHAHSITNTVYLAWSSHTRDLFGEMRKAAKNWDKTAYMADLPDSAENREKYSMGSGYYLSEDRHSGLEIRKGHINRDRLDDLYIAAAEGRVHCPKEEPKPERAKATSSGTSKGVEIIDYSEKALVVIGDTRPLKETLKSLGGRFNARLSCGMGWVFPKSKEDALRAALV